MSNILRDNKGRFIKGSGALNSFAKGNIPWNKGIEINRDKYPDMGHFSKHTKETRKKMSKAKEGYVPPNKGRKMKEEVRKRMIKTLKDRYKNEELVIWNKGKPNMKIRGKNHHNWKEGATSKNEKIRKSVEYKLWRTAVFLRDEHTCQECGQVGGRLHADHIKPFSLFPKLRFAIDNGRTLCKACHKKTDSYGWGVTHLRREDFLNG